MLPQQRSARVFLAKVRDVSVPYRCNLTRDARHYIYMACRSCSERYLQAMAMGRHFDTGLPYERIDREAFKFKHDLLDHDAMSLANLERIIPALPKENVFFSQGLVDRNTNFDRAHIDHPTGLSLEQTLENLRTSNAYIMVRQPELSPSFQPLFRELLSEVEVIMQQRGVGRKAVDPMLYMFIASPNAITPFHLDRYSTMLLQFRGSKQVWVYPPNDARLVPPEIEEDFVVTAERRPKYDPALDHLATCFEFSPGEALHIPFLAPHHVKNGPDDVSISLSIIFNTPATARQLRALRFNYEVRRALTPIGYSPTPVGRARRLDDVKGTVVRTVMAIERRVPRNLLHRGSASTSRAES